MRRIVLASLPLFLAGCLSAASHNDQPVRDSAEARAVAGLSWLDAVDADPQAAVSKAQARGTLELLSTGGRGMPLPGIEPGEREALLARCSVRIMDGVGDVVHGEQHLRYLQRAHDYAERFNLAMKARCAGE